MDKYYTPEIEEFHIGFEFEVEDLMKPDDNLKDINGKHWIKSVIDHSAKYDNYDYKSLEQIEQMDMVYVRNTFRVKYLCINDFNDLLKCESIVKSKDILEKECYLILTNYDVNKSLYENDNSISIKFYPDNCYVEIRNHLDYSHSYFRGTIKNKSELKKLLKQLNIL